MHIRFLLMSGLMVALASCSSTDDNTSPAPPPEPKPRTDTSARNTDFGLNFDADLLDVVHATTTGQCDSEVAERNGYVCVPVQYGTNRTPHYYPQKADDSFLQDVGWMYGPSADYEYCEPSPVLYRSADRSEAVCHLGEVSVAIPAIRRGGDLKPIESGAILSKKDLESRIWNAGHTPFCDKKRFELAVKNKDDRYVKFCKGKYVDDPNATFMERVRDTLGNSGNNSSGHAIVYIHGFNVKFRDAAMRAGQLKYDMRFDGPVMLYSWPANGNTTDYLTDQVDGDLSVDGLVRFLRLAHKAATCTKTDKKGKCIDNGTKVHIIAHSMGARVTSQALARLSTSNEAIKFGEVIFASGDVDSSLFEKWVGSSLTNVDGVTIYTSRYDGAVQTSYWLRSLNVLGLIKSTEHKKRIGVYNVGDEPFVFKPDANDQKLPIHTIDMSALSFADFFWVFNANDYLVKNHAIYALNYQVTDDMLHVMCSSTRLNPEQRGVGKPVTTVNGEGVFWRIDKEEKLPENFKRDGCQSNFKALHARVKD